MWFRSIMLFAAVLAPTALVSPAAAGASHAAQSAPTVQAASTPPSTPEPVATPAPDITDNPFIPENANLGDCVSSLPRPECGSTARGGVGQWLVFGALLGGLTFIGWRIARGIRSNRPTPQQ